VAPANPVERSVDGFSYLAQDRIASATRVVVEGMVPGSPLTIGPRARHSVKVEVTFTSDLTTLRAPVSSFVWQPRFKGELSADEQLVLNQAVADVASLMLHTDTGRTVAAGVPNYVVPFGRDSIITAWLLLDVDPDLSRSVLSYLAARQGRETNDFNDEEPGKILHEHRESELSRIGELPFRTYYGSADSTPLFLVLMGDYVARTGDIRFAQEMEPNWRAALRWIEQYSDRRGLINFRQRSDGKGIIIQSWKDSPDSMSYSDGRLGRGPLAVAEVQGYVFAAYKAAAGLMAFCGASDDERRELLLKADRLAHTFDAAFWMPQHDNYALAIDADDQQLDVNSSDSGHLLWSGIVPRERADRLITRLFEPDLWSGYGLRTLSAREKRYNPLSYHNGSVWPHDTALFAAGLKRHGAQAGFNRVREALTALATISGDKRLPELVGGYPREGDVPPLPYIESCRPQAWSAAALIYVLNA
jgi:glycogen debranching enzyme